MAKRRHKKRTHAQPDAEATKGIPKSMVIRVGQTSLASHSLNQLVKDFRQIMQPHTAIKLKERKSNKLKDFVVMCGPLQVSHLFMFTQSERTGNVSLKVARTPRGPTITFQVLAFSLAKDIKKYLKRPKSLSNEDVSDPPLLVLNGFNHLKKKADHDDDEEEEEDEEHNVEKVVVSMFQNIFPPLNPARTQLNSIKRVFMINKDPSSREISMRHYFIDVREVDISKNLKRLYKSKHQLNKAVPNLHRKEDISSLILDHDIGAYTSESEVEDDSVVRVIDRKDVKINQETKTDKETSIPEPQPVATPRKKAIKLTEVGPRLTLKLVKIEEDICSGKVLHHEYIKKTSAEIKDLEKRHAAKKRLKEQRKKEQEENIAKKKAAKEAKKQRKLGRRAERKSQEGKDIASNESDKESSSDEEEEEEDYKDIPEDLDSDLFSELDE